MPLLKSLVERVLVASAAGGGAIQRMRGRTLVLAYHNVIPPGAAAGGDRSLHLAWPKFIAQLDLLERHVEVVPLVRLLEARAVQAQRPQVAITFDDAYAGAVSEALPELARRGMPATVFVAPALLDGAAFWWDRLADRALGAVRDDVRLRVLEEFAGRDADAMAWAASKGLSISEPPSHARGATVAALDQAGQLPGITMGAHTWTHPNVARLKGDEMERELARPLAWLNRFGTRAIPALAYPYGLFDDVAERAARALGYALTFRVTGGWMESGASATGPLPRLNVSTGLSADGFRLRLAGLLAR